MIVLTLPADTPDAAIEQIKLAAVRFPGAHELHLRVPTTKGLRRLTFGREWLYAADTACLAALREFGRAEVVDTPPKGPTA